MRRFALCLIGALGLLGQCAVMAEDDRVIGSKELVALIANARSSEAGQAAARLLAAAEAGNSFAMYDIGTLSRQSEREADMALGYDPGRAIQWLLRAFDGGRSTAAYKLALTYRDIGDTLEAMAWAQVSDYYNQRGASKALPRTGKRRGNGEGMLASLMASLYAELGDDQAEAIRLRTIALLQAHGPKYEAAQARDDDVALVGDIEFIEGCVLPRKLPRGIWQRGRTRDSGLVEALVQIDAQGAPIEVHLFDFSRRALDAATTEKLISTYRCPAGSGPRWTFANISLDDGRYRLAPK